MTCKHGINSYNNASTKIYIQYYVISVIVEFRSKGLNRSKVFSEYLFFKCNNIMLEVPVNVSVTSCGNLVDWTEFNCLYLYMNLAWSVPSPLVNIRMCLKLGSYFLIWNHLTSVFIINKLCGLCTVYAFIQVLYITH